VGIVAGLIVGLDVIPGSPLEGAVRDGWVGALGDAPAKAQLSKRRLEEARAKVKEQIATIEERLSQFDTLQSETHVLEEFQEMIPALRDVGTWLVDSYPRFQALLAAYLDRLPDRSAKLNTLSSHYRQKAERESNEEIRQNYVAMARDCQLAAEQRKREAEDKASLEQRVSEKMVVVRKSLIFCDDFEAFLLARDDGQDQEIEEFLRRLDEYLSSFEQALSLFRQLSDKVEDSNNRSK